MKNLLVIICLFLFYNTLLSQSPEVIIKFKLEELMYHGDTCSSVYTIKQEQCKFRDADINFVHDTSSIDWKNIPDSILKEIKCIENNSITKKSYVIDYKFSNQFYVYENIFKFIITRDKCGKSETMKISFPVRISSFVTFIDLGKIYFVPGDYDITDKLEYSVTKNNYLQINLPENSLPNN